MDSPTSFSPIEQTCFSIPFLCGSLPRHAFHIRSSEPTDISALLSEVALMRGFRIIHHTEKVGVAVGRIRPDPEGETHLDPQQGRVTKRVRLRRCWPGLGVPLALPSKCLKSCLLGCHLTTVWIPVRSLGRSSVRHTMCAAAVSVMGSGRRVGCRRGWNMAGDSETIRRSFTP